jgi:hypothetical protein
LLLKHPSPVENCSEQICGMHYDLHGIASQHQRIQADHRSNMLRTSNFWPGGCNSADSDCWRMP